MIWLIGQVWPWLVLSAALGSISAGVSMLRRVPVERWVEVPAEDPEAARSAALDVVAAVAAATQVSGPAVAVPETHLGDGSPFPPLPGHDGSYRPWEAEEMWSRPARPARQHGDAGHKDAWSEAAASWRDWAEEAVSRADERDDVDDVDLFAADREAERLGLEAGVFSTSLEHLLAVREEGAAPPRPDAEFPYAEPIEAPAYDPDSLPGPGRLSA